MAESAALLVGYVLPIVAFNEAFAAGDLGLAVD